MFYTKPFNYIQLTISQVGSNTRSVGPRPCVMPFPTCCLAFHVSCQALCVVSLALNYLCTPRHTWLVPMSLSMRIDLDSLPKLTRFTNKTKSYSNLEPLGEPITHGALGTNSQSQPKRLKPRQHQVALGPFRTNFMSWSKKESNQDNTKLSQG